MSWVNPSQVLALELQPGPHEKLKEHVKHYMTLFLL
jgi:hypothetical protein